MARLQLPDSTIAFLGIPSTAPDTSTAGIDLTASIVHSVMRPTKWLVTVSVTVAPSDLTLWGLLAQGSPDVETDDIWGLHNDKYLVIKGGKIGTALAVGSHHFIVTDLGIYARIYFQKSAGTVDVRLTPIVESDRSM